MGIEELQNKITKHISDFDETDIRFLSQILIFIERYIKEKGRR